jgi:mRNA-degrading endonuclease RelE of RelBE toxin-antitoxin system
MNCKVTWTDQVESYVRSKAPEPRRALFQGIKGIATWDGRARPPEIRRLEDDLLGYCRLREGDHRLIFREGFEAGEREIRFLYAGPRSTVYETFQELLLDELAD